MAGNITPIFSRVGDIQGPVLMLNPVSATASAGATGYVGTDANTYNVYFADATNGGFVQRIRLKANGTNPANVVRFWICNGLGNIQTTTSAPTTPTATLSATQTTNVQQLTPATYFMKVQAIDAFGQPGVFSTEISNTVPAGGNNIVWGWSAPSTTTQGVSAYRMVLGLATNQEQFYIANIAGSVTSFTQNTSHFTTLSTYTGGFIGQIANSTATYVTSMTYNSTLIGEISLPATTAIATAGTVDIDYPLNIALPPGYSIIAGLGTATANGWYATAIAGKY